MSLFNFLTIFILKETSLSRLAKPPLNQARHDRRQPATCRQHHSQRQAVTTSLHLSAHLIPAFPIPCHLSCLPTIGPKLNFKHARHTEI
uniref:Secreted protein n=1 Tax=Panagrellus redivivus TaxID=6233 RepID=A0A7E4W5H3_PANRE